MHEPRFDQVTRYAPGHDVIVAGLSPDGERLAFTTTGGGLFVRNNSTSLVHEVDPPAGLSVFQLFFASDAGLLAIGTRGDSFEAWNVPLDGGAGARLPINPQTVAMSHDRKRIAWLNGRHEVWTTRLDGTAAQLFSEANRVKESLSSSGPLRTNIYGSRVWNTARVEAALKTFSSIAMIAQ